MDEILRAAGMAFALPAGVALVTGVLAGRLLPTRGHWLAAPVAFAAACWIATLVLRPWSELSPTRHFLWPLYLSLAGMILAPLAVADDSKPSLAWRWQLLAAVFAAIVVVPAYPSLSPPRWVQIPFLTVYLFGLTAGLTALYRRVSPVTITAACAASALTVAALSAALVTVSYGIRGGMAAGALAGCCGALWLTPRPQAAGGLAVSYALVVGSWGYIAARESSPWLWGAMAAAMAPLALWSVAGDVDSQPTLWRTVAQWGIVGSVLAAAAIWSVWAVR